MSNPTDPRVDDQFREWAIVDVMGHQRFIGRVTEQVIAGQGFIRIDIPEINGENPVPAWSKLVGPSSIYAITPISEVIARQLAARACKRPIERYELPDLVPRIQAMTTDDPVEYSIDKPADLVDLDDDDYDEDEDDGGPW